MEVLQWRKRIVRRERVSLTQYLEFQEDQDMTRLLNFTRTQERRREGVFVCFGMKERGNLYGSGGKNMNGGHLMRVDKKS